MKEFRAETLLLVKQESRLNNQDLIQRTDLLEQYVAQIHDSQIDEVAKLNKHHDAYLQASHVLDSKIQLVGSLEAQYPAVLKQIKAINLMIADLAG
jgi:hypothetical protein